MPLVRQGDRLSPPLVCDNRTAETDLIVKRRKTTTAEACKPIAAIVAMGTVFFGAAIAASYIAATSVHAQAHPEGNPALTCWEGDTNDPVANGGVVTYDRTTGKAREWICSPNGDARWHQVEHLFNSAWVVADATDNTNCYNHKPSPQAPPPLPSAWHLLFGDGHGNWCTRRLRQDWPTTQP